MDLLFVYGTLRRASSHPMARFLEERSTWVGAGKTGGRLYDLGPYPGLLPAETGDDWVFGEVVQLTDAESLPALDRYEGPVYERRVQEVALDEGRALSAWVYVYRAAVAEEQRVGTGRYRDA